jgi:hypothetical protein
MLAPYVQTTVAELTSRDGNLLALAGERPIRTSEA